MATAKGPIRVTRGTKAQVDALTKNKPGRLLASILDPVAANQRVYVEMPNGVLRGLAWEGEGGSGGTGGVYLVTKPKITGSNAGAIGGTVTLTASDSASAFGNDTNTPTMVSFNWILPDGSEVEGKNSVDVPVSGSAGDVLTVRCQAEDGLGNKSQVVEHPITISANQPPSAASVVHDLPETVVKGETYTVNISGGTDADGDAITYELTNLVGCLAAEKNGLASSASITVATDATSVSFDIYVRDEGGLLSADNCTVGRSGSNVSEPSGSSGRLGSGVHVVKVPAGFDTVTIAGRGQSGYITPAQKQCRFGTYRDSTPNQYVFALIGPSCWDISPFTGGIVGGPWTHKTTRDGMYYRAYKHGTVSGDINTPPTPVNGNPAIVKSGNSQIAFFNGGYGGLQLSQLLLKQLIHLQKRY